MMLSHKWELPLYRSTGLIALSTAAAVGLALAGPAIRPGIPPVALGLGAAGFQLLVFVGALLALFYRDPERTPPTDSRAVVSPADGKVIYIRRLQPGTVLQAEKNGARMRLDELASTRLARGELWQIGISMAFSDVHVNRAPIAGTVSLVHRRPGRFLSLRREGAVDANERQTLVIENGNAQAAVVQVASRLVRRIVAYVAQGDLVQRGQRIGIIKFGSQVDLFVPADRVGAVEVAPGQRLLAGQTVICRLEPDV